MNKLTTTALVISAILSTQAFAGKKDELQLELYGKVGFTQDQEGEMHGAYSTSINNGLDYDHVVQDDWTAYRDTRVGLKAGFNISKNFSVHAEGQLDYEAQEVRFDLKEAYLRADKKQFSVEAGRMRTPLYMHSEIQDDEFAMNTYKENIFFSTRGKAFETVDGASFGYEQKFGKGKLELNALYGVAENREDVYYGFVSEETFDHEHLDYDQIAQVEALYKTKHGVLRGAYTLLDTENTSTKISGIGFQQNFSTITFESEAALEQKEVNGIDEDDVLAWRALLAYNAYSIKPYAQYASEQEDGHNGKTESIDFGLNYEIFEYATAKASYELIKDDELDFEDEVVSLAIAFKF